MADLPSDRVTAGGAAFTKVGLDYFVPILVKRGRGREKRYGCLFTCLVTRAVHIEVAHSLDTDSFLSALYRSIARRGLPELIHSDNGRNFVGADEELRALLKLWNQDRTQRGLAQEESSGCSTHPMLPTGGEYGNAKSEQYDEFLRA